MSTKPEPILRDDRLAEAGARVEALLMPLSPGNTYYQAARGRVLMGRVHRICVRYTYHPHLLLLLPDIPLCANADF
jgi:hypothetical protein